MENPEQEENSFETEKQQTIEGSSCHCPCANNNNCNSKRAEQWATPKAQTEPRSGSPPRYATITPKTASEHVFSPRPDSANRSNPPARPPKPRTIPNKNSPVTNLPLQSPRSHTGEKCSNCSDSFSKKNKFTKSFKRTFNKLVHAKSSEDPHAAASASDGSAIPDKNKSSSFVNKFRTLTKWTGGQKNASVLMPIYVPLNQVQSKVRLSAKRTRESTRILNPADCQLNAKMDILSQNSVPLQVEIDLVQFSLLRTSFDEENATDVNNESSEFETTRDDSDNNSGQTMALQSTRSSIVNTYQFQPDFELKSESMEKLDTSQTAEDHKRTPKTLDYLRLGLLDIREGEKLTVLGLYSEPRFLVRNSINQHGLVKLSDLDASDNNFWAHESMKKPAIEMLFEH